MVSGRTRHRGLIAIPSAAPPLEDFEQYLRRALDDGVGSEPVREQLRHHFGDGQDGGSRIGKRLRPRLVLAAAQDLGADRADAMPACAAIELLHNYSLIHDDIEDGDRLRHGRETIWSAFGLAHGVNCGDVVGALAYRALTPVSARLGSKTAAQMSAALASAHVAMCEGQAADLDAEHGNRVTVSSYFQTIEGKTAALFACSARLGALAARAAAADVERCASVGRNFGLQFQIRDDIAGIWDETAATGKTSGGDIARRKKGFPIVWALEKGPSAERSVIEAAYANPGGDTETQTVAEVRAALESAGAREASEAAAATCADDALELAAGLKHVTAFVKAWSGR
ncbi:MAG TPA: polyprenyl synthetase family protein [Candidatus Eremiobacteraceae bacterium]|nr:polyprenyl synthetase family protein [Candidatus Eremiobacteraceae bacterium]